jgi:hypothetical protein
VLETIGDFVTLGDRRRSLDVGPVADVAEVYSAESFFATQHWNATDGGTDFFNYWFLDAQARSLNRLGAPVDALYDFDLSRADADRYDAILAINAFAMDRDEIDRVREMLRGSDTIVVWFYAPGSVGPDGLSIENMERLTGFQFSELEDPGPMLMDAADRVRRETDVARFGVDEEHWPRFEVTDPDATTLGTWTDRDGSAAVARKDVDGWQSCYVGTAPVPAGVLRWLMDEAGVRLWSTRPDVVCATEDAAMITATEGGTRRLELHKPLTAEGGESPRETFDLDVEFGESVLFMG